LIMFYSRQKHFIHKYVLKTLELYYKPPLKQTVDNDKIAR